MEVWLTLFQVYHESKRQKTSLIIANKRLKSWLRRAQAGAKVVKKEHEASEPASVEVEFKRGCPG